MRTLGTLGRALIQSFEELRLKAYRNFPGEPWTCGWGHTGSDVSEETTCTPIIADAWFEKDTAAAVAAVNKLVTEEITQNQFDALVSFTYNLGAGALAHSTLLTWVNYGSESERAADEFLKWDHVAGAEVDGLKRRRKAERDLFNTPEVA